MHDDSDKFLIVSRPMAWAFLLGIVLFPLGVSMFTYRMSAWFWVGTFNAMTVPLAILRCSRPGEPYVDGLVLAGGLIPGGPRGMGPLALPIVHVVGVILALVSLIVGARFSRNTWHRFVMLMQGYF
ncbi:MAG: hypothetical protein H0W86_14090 [Armatimonadetes bacterium]|nr:hypothetical protein [Armatimonadota bacterium]